MATWDHEYAKLCRTILNEGIEVPNRTGVNTIKIPSYNSMKSEKTVNYKKFKIKNTLVKSMPILSVRLMAML